MTTTNIDLEIVSCDICQKDNPILMFEENGYFLNQCGGCGHYYVSPRPSLKDSRHLGEKEKPADAIHKQDETRRKPIFEKYVGAVKKIVPAGKWLDIGCGCGTLMEVAHQRGFIVEGIEVDHERSAYCREAGLSVYEKDIEADDLHPSSYDVVSLINVFSHLRSPMTTFSSIWRILREMGVIIVATSEVGKRAYRDEVDNWHIPDHLNFAGPNTLPLIESKLGFQLSYVSRSLTQKVVLLDKLAYRSERTILNLAKFMLHHIPGLVSLTAAMTCLTRGYFYARHEIVALLQKKS